MGLPGVVKVKVSANPLYNPTALEKAPIPSPLDEGKRGFCMTYHFDTKVVTLHLI
jgi:hypothetical protein